MRVRHAVAILGVLAIAGCDPSGPDSIDGSYVLQLANQAPVPASLDARDDACESFRIRSGRMELSKGSWSTWLETQEVCSGLRRMVDGRAGGAYTHNADGTVTFSGPDHFVISEARSLPGNRLWIVLDGPLRPDTLEYGR